MEFFNNPLNSIAVGFGLGCVLLFLSLWNHLKTKSELSRYKSMLSDKMELDGIQIQTLRRNIEELKERNENLRIKVSQLNVSTGNKIARDLQVYMRAEKQMTVNAPGFAGAWEMAKESAHNQLIEEENGSKWPQILLGKLGFGGANQQALPAESVSKSGGSSENSTAA